MSKLTFQVGFVVSILILLGTACSAYLTFKDFENDADWVSHTERVQAEIENLSTLPQEISNEIRRAVIMNDTLDTVSIDQVEEGINSHYQELDSMVSDNLEQSENVEMLIEQVITYQTHADSIIALMRQRNTRSDVFRALIRRDEVLVDSIKIRAADMARREDQFLTQRLRDRSESRLWAPFTLLVLTIFALSTISYLFINTFSLLNRNEETARQLKSNVDELNYEIAERSSLENLLKNVLDSSTNAIMAFEAIRDDQHVITDFQFTMVNRQASDLVSVDGENMERSRLSHTLLLQKDPSLFEKCIQVVETNQNVRFVKDYDFADGHTWYHITAVKNGNGFVMTLMDVTEQMEYEAELLEKQKELETTNFELEQFAYIASHDLQEPLRKVRTFGDRLSSMFNEALGEKGRDYISRMQNAAERMQVLINDLLKFSRVSRAERTEVSVDLNDPLTETIETLELEIAQQGAEIHYDPLPVVRGDKAQFRQLFQNLLSNAIKYSKAGVAPRVDIHVTTANGHDELPLNGKSSPNYWKISVKDNGIGFDPKYKEQIFVIFQRLHGRTEYSGTGIGLAICEKIVTNHGGYITADGQPGEGAEFTIFLPKQLGA